MGVGITISQAVSQYLGKSCLVENIPSEKLQKAVSYIAHNKIDISDIVAVYDATLFGSMKKGFVITQDSIYFSSLNGGIEFKFIGFVDGWSSSEVQRSGSSKFSIWEIRQRLIDDPWITLDDFYLQGPAGNRCADFLNVAQQIALNK